MQTYEITLRVTTDNIDIPAELANQSWGLLPDSCDGEVVIHDPLVGARAQEKWNKRNYDGKW